MKIRTLLLAGLTAALASCSKQTCKIDGIVESAMDGDTLYIARMTDGALIPTDTIVIRDGKFTLTEKCDSTIIACFYYYNRQSDEVYSNIFFMEDGEVKLQVRPDCKISGTKNNDIYQQFMDSIYEVHEQMSELYAMYEEADTPSEEDESLGNEEMYKLDQKSNEIVAQTVRTHIGEPAGFVLFLSCYNMFEPEEVIHLADKVSKHYQENSILAQIREEAENALAINNRTKFIDVTIPSVDGKDIRLSDVVKAHKLTLVDCWASWCGPCRAEMPNVVALYKKFQSKGLEIVGISFDEDEKAWKDAIKNMEMTWLQCSELSSWDNVMTQKYGVSSIPYTILIDNEGNILAQRLRGKELEKFVEEYLQ